MMKPWISLLLLTGCLVAAAPEAALKSSKSAASASPAASFNPRPLQGDIELPMPAGLSMVLRAVAVPANGMLFDKKFPMGVSAGDADRSLYERKREGYISAPFKATDLPTSWQAKLNPNEKKAHLFFFIGKYEITNAQWDAVMGTQSSGEAAQPKTGISWYDIQAFLSRYNQWLMDNHPALLPIIEGMPAFFRLPSEEEWEFAARGGNLPPEIMSFSDFYLDEGKSIKDYAVFGANYTQAQRIATKLPSRLGIFDMSGNVAEMVQSNFRFTIADFNGNALNLRQHGSAGGLISKGGSFLASEDKDVLPGKRNEIRMFVKADDGSFRPYSARSLGARVVLSNINVPGAQRLEQLISENVALGGEQSNVTLKETLPAEGKTADSYVAINASGDPMVEIDKLIGATGSPFMKSNLYQLKDLISANKAALNRERDENLLSAMRSAIYKADSLRNLAYRCWTVVTDIERFKKQLKPAQIKDLNKRLKDFFVMLDTSTDHYRLSIQELSSAAAASTDEKARQLEAEYGCQSVLCRNMRNYLSIVEGNIQEVRKTGIDSMTSKKILQDVLDPRVHKKITEYRAKNRL